MIFVFVTFSATSIQLLLASFLYLIVSEVPSKSRFCKYKLSKSLENCSREICTCSAIVKNVLVRTVGVQDLDKN